MTFTYNERPEASTRDKVRFLIDDKYEEAYLIENEEIDYLIGVYGEDNLNGICAAALEVMVTKYAKKQETTTSNVRSNLSSISKKLEERAAYFRNNAITSSHFKIPSISNTRKDALKDDTDTPNAFFNRGMFNNPEATSAPERTSDDYLNKT